MYIYIYLNKITKTIDTIIIMVFMLKYKKKKLVSNTNIFDSYKSILIILLEYYLQILSVNVISNKWLAQGLNIILKYNIL